ncbi:MAG: hypothetical protein H0W82_10110 [Actinobacteria bacterium]|nr:hypothetical protein [Actinomycetota bacterium]
MTVTSLPMSASSLVAQDSLDNLWVGGEFKKVGGYWSGDSTNTCDNGRPTAKNQVDRTSLARFAAPGPV